MGLKLIIALTLMKIVYGHIPVDYHHASAENNHIHQDEQDYYGHPKYSYKYGVEDPETGDKKSHQEERDGDVVKGEYSLVEPDGAVRTVSYMVDKNSGFQAHVTRTGGSSHSEHGDSHHHKAVHQHYPHQLQQQQQQQQHHHHHHHRESVSLPPPVYQFVKPEYRSGYEEEEEEEEDTNNYDNHDQY